MDDRNILRSQPSEARFVRTGLLIAVRLILIVTSVAAIGYLLSGTAVQAANPLKTVLIEDGFDNPLFLTSPPGDYQRLFVVEQTGRIKIIKNGALLSRPFLNISSQVSGGSEQGLLGLAFHPDYATNGYFFVDYTDGAGDTHIARFHVSSDPDSADAGSEQLVLFVDQPYSNHNGGMIGFGPSDGYLYVGMGDGGNGGDPGNRAQDSAQLLGKILRIDVNMFPYVIPPSNPYAGSATVRNEIWARGVRNPWRWSFDRLTSDLYIGDVGQSAWEEVDVQPFSSAGGENYGWRRMEGAHCYNPSSNCDPGGLTYPIYEYSHSQGCSITGGYVYRGCAIPDLVGAYFFSDYCSGTIWSFRYNGSGITEFTNRTSELDPAGALSIGSVSSFGEDAAGELYVIDLGDGEIFKIVPDVALPDCNGNGSADSCDIVFGLSADNNGNWIPDVCESHVCGDANGSGGNPAVDIDDIVYLINYVFGGGPEPQPLPSGDANCSGGDPAVDIDDVVFLINYIFGGGPAPCDPDGDTIPNC